MFAAGSTQDPDNSELVIADVSQGGLGLPDRDYYTKTDEKSKETRERYVQHVQKIFGLGRRQPAATASPDTRPGEPGRADPEGSPRDPARTPAT